MWAAWAPTPNPFTKVGASHLSHEDRDRSLLPKQVQESAGAVPLRLVCSLASAEGDPQLGASTSEEPKCWWAPPWPLGQTPVLCGWDMPAAWSREPWWRNVFWSLLWLGPHGGAELLRSVARGMPA